MTPPIVYIKQVLHNESTNIQVTTFDKLVVWICVGKNKCRQPTFYYFPEAHFFKQKMEKWCRIQMYLLLVMKKGLNIVVITIFKHFFLFGAILGIEKSKELVIKKCYRQNNFYILNVCIN